MSRARPSTVRSVGKDLVLLEMIYHLGIFGKPLARGHLFSLFFSLWVWLQVRLDHEEDDLCVFQHEGKALGPTSVTRYLGNSFDLGDYSSPRSMIAAMWAANPRVSYFSQIWGARHQKVFLFFALALRLLNLMVDL